MHRVLGEAFLSFGLGPFRGHVPVVISLTALRVNPPKEESGRARGDHEPWEQSEALRKTKHALDDALQLRKIMGGSPTLQNLEPHRPHRPASLCELALVNAFEVLCGGFSGSPAQLRKRTWSSVTRGCHRPWRTLHCTQPWQENSRNMLAATKQLDKLRGIWIVTSVLILQTVRARG